MALSLEQVVLRWEDSPSLPRSAASFCLAGVRLDVVTDDASFLNELETHLGAPRDGAPKPFAALIASVRAIDARDGFGLVRFDVPSETALSPADFLLGLDSPEFPFRLVDSPPQWTNVALRGDSAPFFALKGRDCLFRLVANWRTAVSLLLFQRLMRLRTDAIFFHASSVALGGQGIIFVGPKGAGKSTIALALAARGHALLGDENACYLPAQGVLLPFRRPVGVKPGPRSKGVGAALARLGHDLDRDGPLRIDPGTLFPGQEPPPAPLRSIIFLEGFAPAARLEAIDPGREELARLQPVGSSLVNAARTRRVFEMACMLFLARVFRLGPGAPDETADRLEEVLAAR